MWGVGPAVDLFGKYLEWAPDTGGGAGRTPAQSAPVQCPRGGRLKRPLTHVGNSDCIGDARARWNCGGRGLPFLWRNLSLFRVIIVIVYFSQMTEAIRVTPGRYWVVLPSPRQVPFSEVGSVAG